MGLTASVRQGQFSQNQNPEGILWIFISYNIYKGIKGCWIQICCIWSSKMSPNASKLRSNMAATARLKTIFQCIFLTKQGTNINQMCFCKFSYMGNSMPYSDMRCNVKKLLKYCKEMQKLLWITAMNNYSVIINNTTNNKATFTYFVFKFWGQMYKQSIRSKSRKIHRSWFYSLNYIPVEVTVTAYSQSSSVFWQVLSCFLQLHASIHSMWLFLNRIRKNWIEYNRKITTSTSKSTLEYMLQLSLQLFCSLVSFFP